MIQPASNERNQWALILTRMKTVSNITSLTRISAENFEVSLTANLYWSMVESGVALIAVCLPTFRALLGKAAPEGILQSFRRIFTLHSRSSQSHQTSHKSVKLEDQRSSTERFVPSSNDHEMPGIQSYAMHDLKAANSDGAAPKEGILVHKTLSSASREL